MTAERFTYYLQNPSHLYQISYQELKSLVVQYPYCQNLRYLLVTKSQLDNSAEYQKDLQLAATYSVDRNYLYHLVNKEETTKSSDNFILNDDYLELKDISETKIESETITAAAGLGSAAGVTAGLAKDNLEIPSATKTKNDYVPHERIVKRIKRVSLDESSKIENTETSEIKQSNDPIDPVVDIIIASSIEEKIIETTEDDENTPEIIESVPIEPSELEAEVIELETNGEDEIADNISDEPEMIAYMEKPKKRRSVIDQLLGRTTEPTDKIEEEIQAVNEETHVSLNAEDELESPQEKENPFIDLTPVKDRPTYGREVLFEITNKTDKEMDALLQRNQPEEKDSFEKSKTSMNKTPEKILPKPADENSSAPSPKTSFKSYLNQFQPPTGVIKDIEDEKEIVNIIEETVEEVKNETDFVVEIKKEEKKKKKKMAKTKAVKIKSKKKDKGKKKKKDKSFVKKVAKQSIQESEDIFSETLAELLASQGSRKKAIQMYKRLSLIFPKKSSFFAEKIKKLKKK